jgi:hypothetical protein
MPLATVSRKLLVIFVAAIVDPVDPSVTNGSGFTKLSLGMFRRAISVVVAPSCCTGSIAVSGFAASLIVKLF